MFTDDIGKYRKDSSRLRFSSEIGAYRRPPYGLARCTDDIAPYRRSRKCLTKCTDDITPFQGKSFSASVWISMFVFSFGVMGVVLSLLFFAGAIR
jgi:hypothetical protein